MNRALVYIIFGASGSGKTTLIAQLKQLHHRITIHEKGTTRELRSYDEMELKSVSESEIEGYDYVYSNYGYKYGIDRRQIEGSLNTGKHHFIICNDKQTILKLKDDFKDRIRVIFLLFDKLEDTLIEIQQQKKIDDDEINLRIEKYRALNAEFNDIKFLCDAVIMNKFGAPQIRMYNQAVAIINSEEGTDNSEMGEIMKELQILKSYIRNIADNSLPNISSDGIPIQDNFVFIAMAMDSRKSPIITDIHRTIKRVCAEQGMNAQRVDETFQGGILITPKVLNHIRMAEVVIADISFESPNVYYEVGYAHAIGKKVILTFFQRNSPDNKNIIHFDLGGRETIYYENFSQLEEELARALLPFKN